MQKKRILIIEDEADIAALLLLHLADLGVEAQVCRDGAHGLTRSLEVAWDLLILDLRLPGLDGLEICRRLRAQGNRVPILMLTAKTSELDRVLGLEVGADDYVLKPFSVLEVMARVRALLRRVSLDREPRALVGEYGALSIDESRHLIQIDQHGQIDLTPREFDLLIHFARHPGKVFRRAQLLDQVWGYGHESYEHTVNSHINRLRTKLMDVDPEREYIITVWGVGYKFNENLLPRNVA